MTRWCRHVDRIEADGYDRVEVGRALTENYLHQILDVGVFHGDPHQGNIMLSQGVPYWIDFGMMGRIDERSMGVIQDLIFALVMKDSEALTNAALAIGKPRAHHGDCRLRRRVLMAATGGARAVTCGVGGAYSVVLP